MKSNVIAQFSLLSALLFTSALSAAQPAPPPAPVVVDSVISSVAQNTQDLMTGHIQARHEMTLMARQAGELTFLREPGEYAAKGEVLAAIDSIPLELRLTEQRANLGRNKVSLANVERRIQRFNSLDQRDFVATNELDDLHEQRDLSQADIAITRAQISQLEDQIRRTQIKAPYDGVVVSRSRNPGEYVTQGATLGGFVGSAAYELRVQIPLQWRARIQQGSPLNVIQTGRTKPLIAQVRAIIPAVAADTQSFEVRADLPAPQGHPWPVGQLVQVEIPSEQISDALMVPRDALVLRREGARVIRITAENTAEWVPVTAGQGLGDWIVVAGDLHIGDRIAVRGAERLAAGQAVEVLRDLAQERAGKKSPAAAALSS